MDGVFNRMKKMIVFSVFVTQSMQEKNCACDWSVPPRKQNTPETQRSAQLSDCTMNGSMNIPPNLKECF